MMSKKAKRWLVNTVLIIASPFLVLGGIMTYDPELTVLGSWILIFAMSAFALGVWIWDEKKQNKADD